MGEQSLDFGTVWAAWDQLLAGAGLTMLLTVQTIALGMVIAIPAAWAKVAGPPVLRRAIGGYVEVIRNTPFLLQLYFFFFGLPSLGIRLRPTEAALLAMVINLAAYATEIVRAGIEAVPRGLLEAGRALGLRPTQLFGLVVLPPTLRAVYQPLAGQFTMVLLGSSITSSISADELTSAANSLQAATFRTFETYFVVTFMYLAMVFVMRFLLGIGQRVTLRGRP